MLVLQRWEAGQNVSDGTTEYKSSISLKDKSSCVYCLVLVLTQRGWHFFWIIHCLLPALIKQPTWLSWHYLLLFLILLFASQSDLFTKSNLRTKIISYLVICHLMICWDSFDTILQKVNRKMGCKWSSQSPDPQNIHL